MKLRCDQDTLRFNPLNCKVNCISLEDKTELEFGRLYPKVNFLTIMYCDLDRFPVQIANDFPSLRVLNIFNNPSNIKLDEFQVSPNLEQFWMSNSSVSQINKNTFENASQLLSIIILNSKLQRLAPEAFLGLANLRFLEMSENSLNKLDKSLFRSLVALTVLNLKKNRIQDVPKELFEMNVNLEDINLSYNQITFMNNETFNHLTKLKVINLNRNWLQTFTANVEFVLLGENALQSVFIGEKTRLLLIENNAIDRINCTDSEMRIEQLIAYNNVLTNKSMDCIERMPNLSKLIISKNNFTKITETSFESLKMLKELDISENQQLELNVSLIAPYLSSLTTLKIDEIPEYNNLRELFPELSSLGLSTENWNCSQLGAVFESLNEQKISLWFNKMDDDNLFCPSNYHTNRISKVEKMN